MSYCVLISFKLFVFVAFMLFFGSLSSLHTFLHVLKAEKICKINIFTKTNLPLLGFTAQRGGRGGLSTQIQGAGELLAARTSGSAPLWDSAGCYDTAEEAARRAFTQQIDGFTAQKV